MREVIYVTEFGRKPVRRNQNYSNRGTSGEVVILDDELRSGLVRARTLKLFAKFDFMFDCGVRVSDIDPELMARAREIIERKRIEFEGYGNEN